MDASRLVEALEQVWAGIQDRHPDVPAVVVTLGSGSIGVPAGQLKLGHFAEQRWVTPGDPAGLAELFVGGEGLAAGPTGVLETLLHEAVHGIASVRGIQDTSRQGRYHNSRFRQLGEEIGLTITKTDPIGWSGTALAPGTAEEYVDELAVLTHALVSYRHSEHQLPAVPGGGPGEGDAGGIGAGGAGAGGRPKNGYSLTCGCRRKIRASAAVAEAGPIVCGLCGTAFTPAGVRSERRLAA
jgi:hypothetical protein